MRSRLRYLPFYLGGFMGPYGTAIILPMFPELRETLNASNDEIGWGFTAYLIPMACFMLVSGTIGERFGKTRVLRLAFLVFGLSALATGLAPNLAWFLAGRALMGSCNAFFTPLLLAALADVAPERSLGKHVGIYASFQTAGGALSPLISGFAAAIEWRSAFVGTALISLILMLTLPKTEPGRPTALASLRPLMTPRVMGIGVAMLFGAAGPFGAAALLIGLTSRDLLDLEPTTSGAIIFAGSVAGLLMAPFWGKLVDSMGIRWTSLTATLISMASVALLAAPRSVLLLTLAWCLAGGAIVGMVVTLQNLAATAIPANRGGALSLSMSFRFVGHALAPILWVPAFGANAGAAFIGAAALGAGSLVALWFVTNTSPAPLPAPTP